MQNNGLIEVRLRGIEVTPMEYVLFLGNKIKTFAIFVGPDVGSAIVMFQKAIKKPRPLTHDLIGNIFLGLGVKIDKVVINELKDNTFYARLFIREENELGRKIIEVDARPSDSIAIALQQKARIFVAPEVFNRVEDVSKLLKEKKEPPPSEGQEE